MGRPLGRHLPRTARKFDEIMREIIRIESTAGTGYNYYTTRNKKKQTDKLELKKYDPIARKHVLFVEKKMPSHSR